MIDPWYYKRHYTIQNPCIFALWEPSVIQPGSHELESWHGAQRSSLQGGLYDEWSVLEVLNAHLSMEFCEYLEDSLGMLQQVFVLLVFILLDRINLISICWYGLNSLLQGIRNFHRGISNFHPMRMARKVSRSLFSTRWFRRILDMESREFVESCLR